MPERLDELESRVARLEHRQGLMEALLDPRRGPLMHFYLETNMSAEQAHGVMDTVESTYQAVIVRGETVTAREFETRLLPLMPEKEKCRAYDFVKRLLITFDETGQWYELVEHYRQDFNVPRIRQSRPPAESV